MCNPSTIKQWVIGTFLTGEISDPDKANHRLTTVTSWLIAMSAILLVLSLDIIERKHANSTFDVIMEFIIVAFLILSVLTYTQSASALVSPYCEKDLDIHRAIKLSRGLLILGTIFAFIALGALILLSFGLTWEGVLLMLLSAVFSPIVWLLFRIDLTDLLKK